MEGPTGWRIPRLHRFAVLVTSASLAVTVVLSWAAYMINDHSEARLLRLKVQETGAVLQAAVATVQTPLTSAAEFATESPDGPAAFRQYIDSFVGTNKAFGSASLWRLNPGTSPQLIATVGLSPRLASDSVRAASFLSRAAPRNGLSVIGFLSGSVRRLGYAYATSSPHPNYVVYAESVLPSDPHIPVMTGTPFSDLRFSLYLGRRPDPSALIESNADDSGARTASTIVPFGDSALTVVASAANQLGGGLSNSAWWIVGIAGGIFSLLAGAVTDGLVRRRVAAESLAGDVQELLHSQRTISESLQRAMVPPPPVPVPGLEVAARYVPGAAGLEIGGDWYDVIHLDEARTFLSIGDVSGRGVQAGAVMASLRSAVRAFVSEGHGPAPVLDRVAGLLSATTDMCFATLLCAVLDRRAQQLTVANAGHLPPLLISGGTSRFVDVPLGPPVGARPDPPPYREQVTQLPTLGCLVFYTDGLVERRGEVIDEGLTRLRLAADAAPQQVTELIAFLARELQESTPQDDTAMLGVHWM